MKKTKRMIALLIALVMVMSMSMSAFAAAPSNASDASVSVTALEDGDIATFYQLLAWAPDNADAVGGWVATADFAAILDKATLTDVLIGDPTANPPVKPSGITSALANKLAKAAKTVYKTPVTAASKAATLANPDAGLYMAIITPVDVDTVYNPVFVGADFVANNKSNTWEVTENTTYSDTSAAKKTVVTLEKIPQGNALDWQTTAIGEQVDWVATTVIPGYGNIYDKPYFAIRDKLTDLELIESSLTVTAGNATSSDYTVTTSPSGYEIVFTEKFLKSLAAPTDVEVSYSALVSTTAPKHVNLEKNEISTEYSFDPQHEESHRYKYDRTNHWTFTIDASGVGMGGDAHGERTSEIVKVARDAAGNPINAQMEVKSEITSTNSWVSPLEGAEFKLYVDADCKTEYIAKDKTGKDVGPLQLVSDADGRITITGLDAGTYYLLETAAPSGFIKDPNAHMIEIEADVYEDVATAWTVDGKNWTSAPTGAQGEYYCDYETDYLASYRVFIDSVQTAEYFFINENGEGVIDWDEKPPVELPSQIVNTQGVELPSTGGIGTTLFYVVGSVLVIGAAVLLISKRRMSTR